MLADLDEGERAQLLEALVNCVYRLGAGSGRASRHLVGLTQAT